MDRSLKWILAVCAIPIAIAVMVFTIYLLHHGYLSINDTGSLSPKLGRKAEGRIIIFGLLAPFLTVLFAILAFFTRKWPDDDGDKSDS